MDTIDGYGKNASPCPSEPLWLQGTLILERPGDLVIPDCQSRTPWAGVTTGYAELQNSMTVTLTSVSCKTQENRAKTGMEECCLKRWVKKELNSFWYSCQDVKFGESLGMMWRS
jgi:hypothetical protein